jgi:Fe2+ transport system protein FeoA
MSVPTVAPMVAPMVAPTRRLLDIGLHDGCVFKVVADRERYGLS